MVNKFSSYLQAALYTGMDGHNGPPAWKWLFIFDGIIGIPIALYGYWAIPDAPQSSRAQWLKPHERDMAIGWMESCGRAPLKMLTLGLWKRIATTWPVYLFCAIFIAHVLAIRVYSYFNLWLKSTHLWSTEEANIIPSAGYGMQIVFTLSYAWASDAIQMRWPLILVAPVVSLIGTILLSVWPEDNIAAMMAGWLLTFRETDAEALIITWINEIISYSSEHQVIVIGVVETAAFTFQAWVPLLIYNTGDTPHFLIGYEMTTMFFVIEMILTLVILWMTKGFPMPRLPSLSA
ncbi:Fc.00g105430.m01.CDS01 [Cosmosporella sp. VM-42]